MSTPAEIAFITEALVRALVEADAMVRAGSFGRELLEVLRHAREVAEILREAVDAAGDDVDKQTHEMAATLAAAVESLDYQIEKHGSVH